MEKRDRITLAASVLSVLGLFIEQSEPDFLIGTVLHILDFSVLSLILWESFVEFKEAPYPVKYLKENWLTLAFLAGFTVLLLYSKYTAFTASSVVPNQALPTILRNIFLLIKIITRLRKAFKLMDRLAYQPAQTVIASFIVVILAGSLALMMSFATVDGGGLSFLDALFTATSAVCVTGLIVVDTASDLSMGGQGVILLLLQIGGLGIMVFSFFAMFAMRRKMSLRDKLTVSYMLGEEDMSGLFKSLKAIILSTFLIEFVGALLLLPRLLIGRDLGSAIFFSVFHAVSAFCNGGFALFSDNLESFRKDAMVTLIIAFLIIAGGISFGVLRDLKDWIVARLRRLLNRKTVAPRIRSLNSKVVLALTGILILSAAAGFYLLEHRHVMGDYSLGEQYLSAFFQSVTLRTAGFNTLPFGKLRNGTLFFMVIFMFIGGASGSTAGGIKVNTLAALWSYFNSFLRQENTARIGQAAVPSEKVSRAFLILLFGLVAVFLGTLCLSLTESAPFLHVLFEVVSAFGTVGLSAGITPDLSSTGKCIIIILMFLGRLGPLTILTAASRKPTQGQIDYPFGDLAIG